MAAQCRIVAGWVRNSSITSNLLSEAHKEIDPESTDKNRKIQLPGATRFSSHQIMFTSVQDNHDSLVLLLDSVRGTDPKWELPADCLKKAGKIQDIVDDPKFWKSMTAVQAILSPMVSALRVFERNDTKISAVLPTLIKMTAKVTSAVSVRAWREPVKEILEGYVDKYITPTQVTAWFLDPSMLLSGEEEALYKACVRTYVKERCEMTTAGEQQAAGAELRRFLTLRRALFGDGNKPVAAVKPDTAVSGDEAALLEVWEDSKNPPEFWLAPEVMQLFPLLSRFASRLLGVPASSSCVERCFSVVRLLHTHLRNRLGPQKIEMLVRCHQFLGRDKTPRGTVKATRDEAAVLFSSDESDEELDDENEILFGLLGDGGGEEDEHGVDVEDADTRHTLSRKRQRGEAAAPRRRTNQVPEPPPNDDTGEGDASPPQPGDGVEEDEAGGEEFHHNSDEPTDPCGICYYEIQAGHLTALCNAIVPDSDDEGATRVCEDRVHDACVKDTRLKGPGSKYQVRCRDCYTKVIGRQILERNRADEAAAQAARDAAGPPPIPAAPETVTIEE